MARQAAAPQIDAHRRLWLLGAHPPPKKKKKKTSSPRADIQDYVNIYALKIWQEELTRIILYNVERVRQERAPAVDGAASEWQAAAMLTSPSIALRTHGSAVGTLHFRSATAS